MATGVDSAELSELDLARLDRMPVELVHWPREQGRRDALARAGVPLLLLVPSGERPPAHLALREDWIRVPADERDLYARARRLGRLAATDAEPPRLDPEVGRLTRAGRTVALSRSEADVLATLLAEPGRIVPRDQLVTAIWPDGAPSARALDSLVYRLRRRVSDLGVVVLTARGRGFLVDRASVGGDAGR